MSKVDHFMDQTFCLLQGSKFNLLVSRTNERTLVVAWLRALHFYRGTVDGFVPIV